MAPVPKRRISRARQGKRRAAINLTLPRLIICKNCKATIMPHAVCSNCGQYKGQEILKLQTETKAEAKKQ